MDRLVLCKFFLVVLELLTFGVVLFQQVLLPLIILIFLQVEGLLQEVEAVGNDHNIGVSRVHLVKGVEEVGEGLVVEDPQKHHRSFFMAVRAVDQGDRAVLHLSGSHGLSVDVV
jgi:hypothetical protein